MRLLQNVPFFTLRVIFLAPVAAFLLAGSACVKSEDEQESSPELGIVLFYTHSKDLRERDPRVAVSTSSEVTWASEGVWTSVEKEIAGIRFYGRRFARTGSRQASKQVGDFVMFEVYVGRPGSEDGPIECYVYSQQSFRIEVHECPNPIMLDVGTGQVLRAPYVLGPGNYHLRLMSGSSVGDAGSR